MPLARPVAVGALGLAGGRAACHVAHCGPGGARRGQQAPAGLGDARSGLSQHPRRYRLCHHRLLLLLLWWRWRC